MYCKITKLSKLKNPEIENNSHGMNDQEFLEGFASDKPKIGLPFYVTNDIDMIRTSPVKSFYIQNSNNDKLVLPLDFPDAKELDFSKVNLKSGEMLIATLNSVYMITDINSSERVKK